MYMTNLPRREARVYLKTCTEITLDQLVSGTTHS